MCDHNMKEPLSSHQAEIGKWLHFGEYKGESMELRGTLTLTHLIAITGGVTKQGGVKLIHKILNTIFTDLSKKKWPRRPLVLVLIS